MSDLPGGALPKTEPGETDPGASSPHAAGRRSPRPPRGHGRRRLPRRALVVAGAAVVVLGGGAAALVLTGQAEPTVRAVRWFFDPPPLVEVGVTPAAAAADVRLDATVEVAAQHGHLTEVEVTGDDGEPLEGEFSSGRTRWSSSAPLAPGTAYEVRWAAVNLQDKEKRATAAFTTLTPDEELEVADVTPTEGETVGVAQPIVVRFAQPVTNKAEVERALRVEHSDGVEGAWSWFGDEEVRYRPRSYWPGHSAVTLDADLNGVDAGDGVWGTQSHSLSFEIGSEVISTVDVNTHQMTVAVDGEVVADMPMSAGRPGWDTQNGVHRVLSKVEHAIFDSATFGMPGLYRTPVQYAVQLTHSGEYVHGAPWSVGSQGYDNVSHGCINLNLENAGWYYELSKRGDVVEVTGSVKEPEETEGMIEWNQSFEEWLEGSALTDEQRRSTTL